MSHHILQQFDEQWLAEIARGDAPQLGEYLCRPAARESEKRSAYNLSSPAARHWLLSIAALILAALALLLAHAAERRADDLQQRLAAHERAGGGR